MALLKPLVRRCWRPIVRDNYLQLVGRYILITWRTTDQGALELIGDIVESNDKANSVNRGPVCPLRNTTLRKFVNRGVQEFLQLKAGRSKLAKSGFGGTQPSLQIFKVSLILVGICHA